MPQDGSDFVKDILLIQKQEKNYFILPSETQWEAVSVFKSQAQAGFEPGAKLF